MLKETILKFLNLENLINNLTGFIDTRVELVKYEVKEEVAKSVSKIVLLLIMGFILMMVLVFISFAVAFKLSDYYGRLAGFFIMAGIYLLIALIVYVMRDSISHKLEKIIFESIKKK